MKKLLLTLLILTVTVTAGIAQKAIDQSFKAEGIKDLNLEFKYPELVKIKVWDKDEVSIKGVVEIQNGDSNDDFSISSTSSNGTLTIESELKNIDRHKSVSIYSTEDSDGETITLSKDGKNINIGKNGTYSNGIQISIVLEVTVPRGMNVTVNAIYGLVEIIQNPKSINVVARYGGIDLSINEKSAFDLEASTQWGQIFSNLSTEFDFEGTDNKGKWIKATASLSNGGHKMKLASQYGNVYLRKN